MKPSKATSQKGETMNTKFVKALLRNTLAAMAVVLSGAAIAATTTVNLTAQRSTITLPDGAVVPMWGDHHRSGR
jgi:hypothetical protein